MPIAVTSVVPHRRLTIHDTPRAVLRPAAWKREVKSCSFTEISQTTLLASQETVTDLFFEDEGERPTRDETVRMLVDWSKSHPEHDAKEAIDGVMMVRTRRSRTTFGVDAVALHAARPQSSAAQTERVMPPSTWMFWPVM